MSSDDDNVFNLIPGVLKQLTGIDFGVNPASYTKPGNFTTPGGVYSSILGISDDDDLDDDLDDELDDE